jgi:hypothetical protein
MHTLSTACKWTHYYEELILSTTELRYIEFQTLSHCFVFVAMYSSLLSRNSKSLWACMVRHKSIFTNLCQVTFQDSECLNYALVEACSWSERNPDCLVIQPVAFSPYVVSYPSSPYTNGKRNLGRSGNRWKEQFWGVSWWRSLIKSRNLTSSSSEGSQIKCLQYAKFCLHWVSSKSGTIREILYL